MKVETFISAFAFMAALALPMSKSVAVEDAPTIVNKLLAQADTAAAGAAAADADDAEDDDDWLTQSVDELYDLRDELQDVVTKSVKGVADAMHEGGPRNNWRPGETTIEYNVRKHNEHEAGYKRSRVRLGAQQGLLNVNAALLHKLPANDPRRAQIASDIAHVARQLAGTRADVARHDELRQAFDQRIRAYSGSDAPHKCDAAPGWHIPDSATCDATSTDSHSNSGHDDH